ncbi:MAG: hypothetical protein EA352_00095, partial [Gemmatimonadales bacterium]
MYQVESDIRTRPTFGAVPRAGGMAGLRAEWDRDLPQVTTFLERVLGRGGEGEGAAGGEGAGARLSLEGELAVSLPDPNVSGDAWLDDFDAAEERTVSLLSPRWHLGSRPEFRDGATELLPSTLQVENAESLTWQHTWVDTSGGDSIGIHEGFLPRSEIDRQINIAGAETREPGLLLQFGGPPGSFLGGTRWRSITTLLSPTGADLSQTEFLDFYAAQGDSLTLIIDLGQVSEDAFFFDEEGRTSGFRTDTGRSWGLGVLDQEADPLRGEVWNRERDDVGVWPETCRAEPGRVYAIGDPDANCTRGNGRRDTEDLNGNGVLDTEERYARYVIRLDGSSPWLVRDRNATGTSFRRYRIPIRGPGALFPAGTFTQADWREVQFMRITVAGSRSQRVTLARMRLVGSRWIKRGGEGILRGLGGDTVSAGGNLEVRPVGVLSEGAAYSSPPGVLEELDDPVSGIGGRGVEFSERALGLRFQDLGPGQRAEVYSRFLQRPRDFLAYRELRLWAVAREGDFQGADPPELFVKVGSDPDNFYLWRTRLDPAADPDGVTPADWLPERVLRFDRWLELRLRAEERLVAEGAGRRGDPVVEWSADSTYAVVLRDRARAPNLAAVREISMGIWNPDGGSASGEVWINELRLGDAVRTPGGARFVSMDLDGGDLLQVGFGWEGSSPWFREFEETTPWQGEDRIRASATAQLGGILPEGWGVDLPVTVGHVRTASDPLFLGGTDLGGRALPGLREAGTRQTSANLTLRSSAETGIDLLDRALSSVEGRVGVARGRSLTPTSEVRTLDLTGGATVRVRPEPRTAPMVPGVLEGLVRVLLPPGMARRLNEAEFRWTPEEVVVGQSVRRVDDRITRFDQVVRDAPGDEGSTVRAPQRWLETRARVGFRPSGSSSVLLHL